MRVGLYVKDKGFSNMDLRYPEKGNPGVGGTEYCFAMLGRYLKLYYKEIEVIYYHYSNNMFPENIVEKVISTPIEGIKKAAEDKVDIFIFANNEDISWYSEIQRQKICSVVWAHCYVEKYEAKLIMKNSSVSRVVFVGKEEYDYYMDHDIIKKSSYIYNMYNADLVQKRVESPANIVTYVGSLTKYKGFYELAKIWKTVIQEIPDAELHVIGSGKLYNRYQKLGKYGIAEKEYEKQFMSYLTDEEGKILNSVFFHGIMGSEKADILLKTKVGIVNPTAKSETFCISAVEMESFGIPVVSRKKNGLLDTVIDGKTGILFTRRYAFCNNIVKLLKDNQLNMQYGEAAKKFVTEMFAPEKIICHWGKLFDDILRDVPAQYYPVTTYHYNNKRSHMFIRLIRIKCGLKYCPSYLDMKYGIEHLIKRGLKMWKN